MKVKEVLEKYHAKVSFPISPKKIIDTGYSVREYLLLLGEDLEKCEDKKIARKVIEAIRQLKDIKDTEDKE